GGFKGGYDNDCFDQDHFLDGYGPFDGGIGGYGLGGGLGYGGIGGGIGYGGIGGGLGHGGGFDGGIGGYGHGKFDGDHY
ncbi:hypothetical protein C6P46_001843, partial [Rhodotorula mucilaginosa]